jgi:DNA repair protein RadC
MTELASGPRDRFLAHGGEQAGIEELIAVILGARQLSVASRLIAHCGGLVALSRASAHEMRGVAGVGPARAARLAAAFHLARRAAAVLGAAAGSIHSPDDVYSRLSGRFDGLQQEVFVALALDVRNVVIEEIEIARGCLTSVEVHPREVFRPLIRSAAAAAVVAHNHPSGDPSPSSEDIALTQRLRAAGDLVGIPLLDHVIIGRGGYVSLGDQLWG